MPILKHSGNGLIIEYNCGNLVLPQRNLGYNCQTIEFHTPSEHKLNGKHFDLEIQIYFKADKKKRNYKLDSKFAVISVLFEGIPDEILDKNDKTSSFINKFLENLELENLPLKKGSAKSINNLIDFEDLFNENKQLSEDIVKELNINENDLLNNSLLKHVNNKDKIALKTENSSNLKNLQKIYYGSIPFKTPNLQTKNNHVHIKKENKNNHHHHHKENDDAKFSSDQNEENDEDKENKKNKNNKKEQNDDDELKKYRISSGIKIKHKNPPSKNDENIKKENDLLIENEIKKLKK